MIRSAAIASLAALTLTGCGGSGPSAKEGSASPAARQPSSLYLSSSGFTDGKALPADYTCDGTGRSPPLTWADAPANTQSFALVLEDPDAPGGTFRHWGVYDIPASTHELAAGATARGDLKQTRNDFDKPGYGPPCPPRGDKPHHYRFRLMALDVARLSGSPSGVKDLLTATAGHVLGTAELTGLYGRR